MLREFFWWFVFWGASILVQLMGVTDQGTAFVCIHLSCTILVWIVGVVYVGYFKEALRFGKEIQTYVTIEAVLEVVARIIATWGVTQLFDVNFAVAYQIITFGQCLCISHQSSN